MTGSIGGALGNVAAKTAGTAAQQGLGDMTSNLMNDFSMKNLMNLLGNEQLTGLLKGGMDIYGGIQTGNMLDFQKEMMKNADERSQTLFDDDQARKERLRNLEF